VHEERGGDDTQGLAVRGGAVVQPLLHLQDGDLLRRGVAQVRSEQSDGL
jgi:hypothetical protein